MVSNILLTPTCLEKCLKTSLYGRQPTGYLEYCKSLLRKTMAYYALCCRCFLLFVVGANIHLQKKPYDGFHSYYDTNDCSKLILTRIIEFSDLPRSCLNLNSVLFFRWSKKFFLRLHYCEELLKQTNLSFK